MIFEEKFHPVRLERVLGSESNITMGIESKAPPLVSAKYHMSKTGKRNLRFRHPRWAGFQAYLVVIVVCVVDICLCDTAMNHVVCEDKVMNLQCPQDEVLRISAAVFGRFSSKKCNPMGDLNLDTSCETRDSKTTVNALCDGKQYCAVTASLSEFKKPDPCPGTSKYLEVIFLCEPVSIEPTHQLPPNVNPGVSQVRKLNNSEMPISAFDGSPKAPKLLSVTAVTATAIKVTWTTSGKAAIKRTKLYYKELGSEHYDTRNLNGRKRHNTEVVEEFMPNTEYVIYLKSYNNRGLSPNSDKITVSTPERERIPVLTTRHPWDSGEHDLFSSEKRKEKTWPPPSTTVGPTSKMTTSEEPEPQTDRLPPPYTDRGDGWRDQGGQNRPTQTNPGLPMTLMCPAVEYQGVYWPQTRSGQVAEQRCPQDMEGWSIWRCVGRVWAAPGPDLSDCISLWLSELDKQVTSVMEGDEEPMTAMKALQQGIARRGKHLLPGDLKRLAFKMLPKLARRMLAKSEKNQEDIHEFQEAVVWTSSQLLDDTHQDSWNELSTRDCRRSATSLVKQLEKTGFEVADNLAIGESSVVADSNVVLKATRIDTQTHHSDLSFPSPDDLASRPEWRESSNSITIPSTSLKIAGRTGPLSVVFTVYNNLEKLMEPEQIQGTPESSSDASQPLYNAGSTGSSGKATIIDGDADDTADAEPLMVVNSKVIAASMGSSILRKLPEPVTFTLQHLHPTDNLRPLCSFWEIDTSLLSGRWSQEGCRLIYGNHSHTVCECDHLTNFAVLMDVTGVELPEDHELALRVITYIGCIISIICLLLAWITFTIFKNLQCDRNTIHKNLVLTLLLAEVLFVSGIAQTQPRLLCALVAASLHYLFLSAFAWMCLEGVQLYVMLIQVFEHERSRVKSYYLFGYGIPLVVVAVSAAIYHQGYGTKTHCWLTTDRYFVMSFVGPACAVILINVVMLSIAIYTMCRHSNLSATIKERSKVNKFSAWLKGAVVLVVLLGLTWAFGLLYLSQQTVTWAYVFTVLNSLQGLFIFVFHCLKNEKVQKEYRKVARHTTWLPNCIRVHYGGYNVRASSSRPNSTGSGNYLSKLFGGSKRRSAASTNSSAKPFLSMDQQRKSDIDNSGSRCSASCESANIPPPSPHPTLLNGYVYDPSYSHLNGYSTSTVANGNGVGGVMVAPHTNSGCSQHHSHQLAPCYEEVIGELSEVLDCSFVDSEMVTEYCHNNLQVNQEKPRYSTGSEDSVRLLPNLPAQPPPFLDPDNLSTVSMASSSVVHSSTQALPSSGSFPSEQHAGGEDGVDSQGEPLYEEVRTWASHAQGDVTPGDDRDNEGAGDLNPHINLDQYIIPSSRHSSSSVGREEYCEPVAGKPETEAHPDQSCSATDLQFRKGLMEPSGTQKKSHASASNPISFTDPRAKTKSKTSKPNGSAVLPASKMNNATPGSQSINKSADNGKLVVGCAGPTNNSNGQPRSSLQLGPSQSTSEC